VISPPNTATAKRTGSHTAKRTARFCPTSFSVQGFHKPWIQPRAPGVSLTAAHFWEAYPASKPASWTHAYHVPSRAGALSPVQDCSSEAPKADSRLATEVRTSRLKLCGPVLAETIGAAMADRCISCKKACLCSAEFLRLLLRSKIANGPFATARPLHLCADGALLLVSGCGLCASMRFSRRPSHQTR
jgi:hypothetical protein